MYQIQFVVQFERLVELEITTDLTSELGGLFFYPVVVS